MPRVGRAQPAHRNEGERTLARTINDRSRVAAAPAEAAEPSRHFGYQPALDGIRAFAVGAVLFYHAGESWAVGGFLGVDTFFVLSGFLITTLLVTEWTSRGGIDLLAFWVRRARRLLPALFLVMVGIVIYAGVFAGPDELGRIRADSLASLGYVANWRFIVSGQSYFDQFSQPSPLRHMWSLAIEEQFYLVWPLVVACLLWWRKSLRVLLVACIVLLVASAALMAALYVPGGDPSRVYYGTDTRAQSLLIGAVVGILLFMHGPLRSRAARLAIRLAAAIGAGYTLWLFWRMSERTDDLYRGGFLMAALAVSAVIVSVVQPDRGALGRFLSLAPLRWLGRISYGLYLWHWPVYLTITRSRTGFEGPALLGARIAVSVALATVSFYAVERPIRAGSFRLPSVRFVGVAMVTALVVAVFATTGGGGASVAARTVQALEDADAPPPTAPSIAPSSTPSTAPGSYSNSPFGAPATQDVHAVVPPKVMIVGDSVAGTLGLGFGYLGESTGLSVWNRGSLGCGLFYDGNEYFRGELLPVHEECDWRVSWAQQLDAFTPDVVVMLVGAWDVLDREIDGRIVRFGTVEHDTLMLRHLDEASTLLASRGAKVVILTTPYFARTEPGIDGSTDLPENDPSRVNRINSLYREFLASHRDRYRIIDLNRFTSVDGEYAEVIDGVAVRGDGVHFTQEGSTMVANWLAPQLAVAAAGDDPDPAAAGDRPDSRGLWAK